MNSTKTSVFSRASAGGAPAPRGPAARTTFCGRCRALRWVEDWSERRHEVLSIVLGPCGHVIERTARLEWSIPTRRGDERMERHLNHGGRTRDRVATS